MLTSINDKVLCIILIIKEENLMIHGNFILMLKATSCRCVKLFIQD